jgi:hypothetical protein
MTLIGMKLNLYLLYPIQCMMSMGSSVDVFLFTNASGKFTTSMHSTPSRVLITTNFTTPWSNFADDPDSVIDLVVYHANRARYVCDHETVEAAPKFVMTSEPDYGKLRPRLGWLPVDAIKKTFERTTQLARMPMSTILKK